MLRIRRLAAVSLAAALIPAWAAVSAQAAPTARAVAPSHTTTPLMLMRPATDDPGLRGKLAPVTGVVPGLTGPAAQRLVGPAATAFRAEHAVASREGSQAALAPAATSHATTIHNAWGIFPGSNADTGMMADQSIVPNLTLSGQEFLYAPTLKAPDGSCAELTTAYTPSGAFLWAWDWCVAIDAAKTVPLNASFVSTYTTTVNGHPAYTMYEAQSSAATNTWSIYLYNYTTHAYDLFYRQSGTDQSGAPEGWDVYEVYTTPATTGANGPYCSKIAGDTFESSHIQIYYSGAWHAATTSNAPGLQPIPSGSALGCSSLKFSVPTANSDWVVAN
ncbi:hypothetical protein [Actinospica robiniae]|uniref:hypothetical protein n=1 Tax=Actinospica robiniae TaxID=304901 RepID=UPI00040ED774|nr:hypothetical protein [Actinospica robiniae]